LGNVGEVKVSPPGAVTVKLNGLLALSCGEELSVTWTVGVERPAVVGTPLMLQPVSVKPAGRVPAVIEQAYGGTPPVTPIGAK
jgi:hypothetical protein